MKVDLARVPAKRNDILRGKLHGPQTLALLKHKVGGNGYTKLLDVATGFRFKGRAGQPGTLFIVEFGDVTIDLIKSTRAFAISGQVYSRVSEEFKKRPEDDTFLEWGFDVSPTGETFSE